MTAINDSTVSSSAAPSDAGHTSALPTESQKFFATLTSPSDIAARLLESINEGADIVERAYCIASASEALLTRDFPSNPIPRQLMTSIKEVLGDAGWQYSIEDGLNRIIELGAPAIGHPSRGEKMRSEEPVAATNRSTDDIDYLDRLGVEESEMYLRQADTLLVHAVQNPDESEAPISGAQTLIEKTRRVLRRLIDEQFAQRRNARSIEPDAAPAPAVDTEILYTLNSAENYTAEMREAFQAIEANVMRFDGATGKDRAIYLSSILALVERGVSRAQAMDDALASVVERLVKMAGGAHGE